MESCPIWRRTWGLTPLTNENSRKRPFRLSMCHSASVVWELGLRTISPPSTPSVLTTKVPGLGKAFRTRSSSALVMTTGSVTLGKVFLIACLSSRKCAAPSFTNSPPVGRVGSSWLILVAASVGIFMPSWGKSCGCLVGVAED